MAGIGRWSGFTVALLAATALASGAEASVVSPEGIDLSVQAGTPFDGPVATFRSQTDAPSELTATVDWGDGTADSGSVAVAPPAPDDPPTFERYEVRAAHTFATVGTYTVTVTITEGNAGHETTATATVTAPPPPPPTPTATAPPEPAPTPAATATATPVAATAPPRPPQILAGGFRMQPRVGRPAVLEVRAVSPDAPIGGMLVNFGERSARSGAIACSLLALDALAPLGPGVATTIRRTYRFRRAGTHRIQLAVVNGACAGRPARTYASFTVVVDARAASTRAASDACPDAQTIPDATNLPAVTAATLCEINRRRKAAGAAPIASDAKLTSAAEAHTLAMVTDRFFEHQGDGEPDLLGRIVRAVYDGLAAENIGYGGGAAATPASIVEAWMDSPPHRTNMLNRDYRGIGIGLLNSNPTGPPKPGATYTTVFGGAAVATAASTSASATASRPAVQLAVKPQRFRAAASGPATRPSGRLGTKLTYGLTRAATVVVTVRRGRRVIGGFTLRGVPGANTVRFTGRLKGRRLKRGTYRLTAVATDAGGRRSQARTITVRIV